VRVYRERPELARHTKPAAQALWDFLKAAHPPRTAAAAARV
jgi:hypothetical protein